jgi:hypothetical protein
VVNVADALSGMKLPEIEVVKVMLAVVWLMTAVALAGTAPK